jgi:SAM-dependent methyltransferase
MSEQKQNPVDIAKQLRKPEGAQGLKIGEFMNKGNAPMYAGVRKHLPELAGQRLLEIGFGNGVTSKEIMQQTHYTGLDYSADMVATAVSLCAAEVQQNGARFVHGDIHQMPFEAGSFDIVFTINTIYFWDDAPAAAAELKRVLKSGGQLFIGMRTKEDMDLLSAITQHGFILRPLLEVEELLRGAGFTNLSYTVYPDPPRPDAQGRLVQLHTVVFSAVA